VNHLKDSERLGAILDVLDEAHLVAPAGQSVEDCQPDFATAPSDRLRVTVSIVEKVLVDVRAVQRSILSPLCNMS